MLFRDRADAGRRLARKLAHLKNETLLVLVLPRGGVPVACEIARELGAPLELLLVRKIGVPWQPELAMGAVVDGEHPQTFINKGIARAAHVSEAEIQVAAKREIEEIERRRALWLGGHSHSPLSGRTVIVVDDGIATGASTRIALRSVRAEHAKRVVLAAPVTSAEAAKSLKSECDEFAFVVMPENMDAVGSFYDDFHQLDDAEVTALLRQAQSRAA